MNRTELWHDFFYRSTINGKLVDPFPMNMMPPFQKPLVSSFEQAQMLLEYYGNGKTDCFYGAYPERLKQLSVIDLIWWDIDYNDHFREKINIAINIIEPHLEDRNIPFRRVTTEHRGVHYYVLNKPIRLKNPAYCIKQWMLTLPDIPSTVKYIKGKAYPASGYDKDSSNIEQLVRVPYTIHPKTGNMVIECYGKLDFMPEMEIRPWEVAPKVHQDLLKYDKEAPKFAECSKKLRTLIKDWPPCIFDAIELLPERDPKNPNESLIGHDSARHLAAFLYRAGMDEDAIVALFSRRPDFSERKTRYQVRNIIYKQVLPNSCRTNRGIGLCPSKPDDRFKWCTFYPNVMNVIRDIVEEVQHQKVNDIHKV